MGSFESHLSENNRDIDVYLASFFAHETHREIERYLYRPLARYTANAGKRHRPLICILACEAVGGDSKLAFPAAAAIEHFHTAALIHDDIADASETRRGEPTMHISEGLGLAINAGDLALSLVTGTVVHDPNLGDALKLRVLAELVEMTTRTIEGQALDIGWARDDRFDLQVEDYLMMANLKTAYYSGAVPLAVGAIVGGGTEEQIEALRSFGLATGLAFQIQDDILNLVGTGEATKKDFRSDITEGKRTLVAVHTLRNSPEAERFEEILALGTTDSELQAEAVAIAEACGAIDHARSYAQRLVAEAKGTLDGVLPASEARSLLESMADFFVSRMS